MAWTTYAGDHLFPDWLMQWLNFGAAYPKGDQDALFALGDALKHAAAELGKLEPSIKSATDRVPQYYEGEGATAALAEFAKLFDANDVHSLPKLIEGLEDLGHDARSTATEIEFAKIQAEIFAALTLWTVYSLLASFYGWAAVTPYLQVARGVLAKFSAQIAKQIGEIMTRSGLKELAAPLSREIIMPAGKAITQVGERLAPTVEKLGTPLNKWQALNQTIAKSPAVVRYPVAALKGGAMGAGLDAGSQVVQIMEGHRDGGFDLKQTFQTAIQWGAGGAAGGLGHDLTNKGLSLLGKEVPKTIGGRLTGGIAGGVVGAGGMYAAGLGTQLYDNNGNWDKVNKEFSGQLLAGGLFMGAAGGGAHGLHEQATEIQAAGVEAGPKQSTVESAAVDKTVTPQTLDTHQQPAEQLGHPKAGDAGQQGGGTPSDSAVHGPSSNNGAATTVEPKGNQPETRPGGEAGRPAAEAAKPADNGARPAPNERPSESAVPKEAAVRPAADSSARVANVAPTDQKANLVASVQDKPAQVPAGRAPEVRPVTMDPAVRPVRAEPAIASTNPSPVHEVPVDRSPVDRTPSIVDEPVKQPSDLPGEEPLEPSAQPSGHDQPTAKQDPGTHPLDGDHGAPHTDPGIIGPDQPSGHAMPALDEPALIITPTTHPGTEHPLEVRRRIDKVTGVEPDPALAKAKAEFEDFYKEQNAEAEKPTDVTPHDSGTPSATPVYEARRYSYGPDEKLTTLTVRVHLDEVGNVSPAHLREVVDNLHATTDRVFNTGERLLSGDRLRVELEFVDDPAAAHLKASVGNPHEATDPHVLNRETPTEVLAERLREHVGLSKEDHGLADIDLRHISNEIAHANTDNILGGLPETRAIGPDRLGDLEQPKFQWDVEDALRDGDRFLVGADPRTNLYGELINDGGPHTDVRRYNCLEQSLAALSSFYGDPQVGLPRHFDVKADGTFNEAGESGGMDRAKHWLGNHELEWPPGSPTPVADQFAWLHDHISQNGELSAALVVNTWHALDANGNFAYDNSGNPIIAGSHATVVVYPRDASGPVWWDPQAGTMSDTPPPSMVTRSASLSFITVDPNGGIPGAGATHQGTGGTVSPTGPHHPAEPGDRPVPDETRLGGLENPDAAGVGGGRGDTGDRGLLHSEPPDRSGNEPRQRDAPADLGREVRPGDRDREADTRQSDLSAPLETEHPTDTGGSDRDRVPGDHDVADRTAGTDHGTPPDREQGNPALSDERGGNPGTGREGDGLGELQPPERDLAGTPDPRVLDDADQGAQPKPANSHSPESHSATDDVVRTDADGRYHDQRDLREEQDPHLADRIATDEEQVVHPQDAEPVVPEPTPIDPHEIESQWGIPEENQRKIQAYADEHDLIIEVRPTNPDAVRHLHDGAMPKPMSIKDKTINDLDVELGAPPEAKGLVGRFRPDQLSLPHEGTVSREHFAELKDRYEKRVKDFEAYREHMDELIDQGTFKVTPDGVVEGKFQGEWKPVTGDHDLYDVRHADGSRLSPEEELAHRQELVARNAGIQHGPHVYWEPAGEFQRVRNFEDIVNKHQFDPTSAGRDNEPLVRFRPGEQTELTWATKDLDTVDREMTPWHIETDLTAAHENRLGTIEKQSQAHFADKPDATPVERDRFENDLRRKIDTDMSVLRDQVRDLANHPGFDHAAYRAWLDDTFRTPIDVEIDGQRKTMMFIDRGDGINPVLTPVESPARQLAELRQELRNEIRSEQQPHTAESNPGNTPVARSLEQAWQLGEQLRDSSARPSTRGLDEEPTVFPRASDSASSEPGGSHPVDGHPETFPAQSHPAEVDWTSHVDDHWSQMNGREISEELERRWAGKGLETEGFDHPDLHPEVVREFARAVDDMLSRYPDTTLPKVTIETLPGDYHAATAWNRSADGTVHTEAVILNLTHALAPDEMARSFVKYESEGHFGPGSSDRPIYSTIVHEFGHVIDLEGQRNAAKTAMDALDDHYRSTRGAMDPAAYAKWLDQLSDYSFEEGRLDPTEALAEAFADVELNGERASEPAKVLYQHLLESATTDNITPKAASHPKDLTPELRNSFEELRARATEIDRASADPARADELASLHQRFAEQYDALGLRDSENSTAKWQLFDEHDSALSKYLAEYSRDFLPPTEELLNHTQQVVPHEPHLDPDRPSTLTPHLGERFEQIRERINDIFAATHDPARTPELPGLRVKFAELVDRLGLRDQEHWGTAWQLFNEHDATLAKYVEQNHEHLLPRPEDAAEPHVAPDTEPASHEQNPHPHVEQPKDEPRPNDPDTQPHTEIPETEPTLALTPDEHDALRHYTDPDADVYSDLNHRMRNELELTAEQQKLAADMTSGLEKLPTYDGTVWSGAHLTPEQLARYVPGAKVPEPSFTSTSRDPRRIFTSKVEFIIHSETGRDISAISTRPGEKEVLFKPDAIFDVRGVVEDPNAGLFGVTRVYLYESTDHAPIRETPADHPGHEALPNDHAPVHDAAIQPPEELPVRHGTDRTALGDSPEVQRVYDNVRNEGEHDVVIHGDRFGKPTADGGFEIDPQKVVEAIRNNPHYVEGTPVRLLSCHSGNDVGWAQHIANELGVPVRAPSDLVGVRALPDSPAVLPKDAEWRTFHPSEPDGTTPKPTAYKPTDNPDRRPPRYEEDPRENWDILGNEKPDTSPAGSAVPDTWERPPHDYVPLERGGPLEEQIRAALKGTAVKHSDVNTILDNLARHEAGKEIAEVIACERFKPVDGFSEVVSNLSQFDGIPGCLEQIRLGERLLDRGFSDLAFEIKREGHEIKPGVFTGKDTDLDLMARDHEGKVHGWQFKDVHSTIPKNVIGKVFKEKGQLLDSGADFQTFVLDTVVSSAELGPHLERLERNYANTQVQVIIRTPDGIIFIPPEGRFMPEGAL